MLRSRDSSLKRDSSLEGRGILGRFSRRGSKTDSLDRSGKLVKSDSESGTEGMGLSGGGGGGVGGGQQRGLGASSSIDSMDLFKSAKSSHPSDTEAESSTGRKKNKKKAVQKVGRRRNIVN